MRGSNDRPADVEGRTLEAATLQLLPSLRHHLSPQPPPFLRRPKQDGLPQPLHMLPAMYEDRRLLLPLPGL